MSFLLPAAATAQSVAVLPISYKIYRTADSPQERADKVKETVKKTVEKIGMTVADDAATIEAARLLSPDGDGSCTEDPCLSATARKVGADFGAAVSIVDNDGMFDITVHVSGADPAAASPFGTFGSMLKRVSGMVEASLVEAVENQSPAEASPPASKSAPETIPEPKKHSLEAQTAPSETTSDLNRKRKGIPKAAFWSTLGVTLGLGAVYSAVEGVGYAKWQDQKDSPDRTSADESKIKHLRVSSRVLAGSLAAGLVTTVVFSFLTDFSKDSNKLVAAPAFTDQSGGVMLQGEF